MKPTFKGTLANFNGMCGRLANMTGASFQQTVEYETAKVMEAAVRLTPAASVAKIRNNHDHAPNSAQLPSAYTPRTAAGRKHRAGAQRFGGKLLYNLSNHYPDELWAAIVHSRGLHLKEIIRARGLSKRTWFELARMFGFEITTAGFVRAAVSGKVGEGRFLAGMTFRRRGSRSQFSLRIRNAQPTINAIEGEFILRRAMGGRVGFFKKNLKHRVFEDVKTIARAYPGVRTH